MLSATPCCLCHSSNSIDSVHEHFFELLAVCLALNHSPLFDNFILEVLRVDNSHPAVDGLTDAFAIFPEVVNLLFKFLEKVLLGRDFFNCQRFFSQIFCDPFLAASCSSDSQLRLYFFSDIWSRRKEAIRGELLTVRFAEEIVVAVSSLDVGLIGHHLSTCLSASLHRNRINYPWKIIILYTIPNDGSFMIIILMVWVLNAFLLICRVLNRLRLIVKNYNC